MVKEIGKMKFKSQGLGLITSPKVGDKELREYQT